MFAVKLITFTALAILAVAAQSTDAPTPTTTILPGQCTAKLECCATATPPPDCANSCGGLLCLILSLLGLEIPAIDGPLIGIGCQTEEVFLLPILPAPCNGSGLCCNQVLNTTDASIGNVGLGCEPVNLNLLGLDKTD